MLISQAGSTTTVSVTFDDLQQFAHRQGLSQDETFLFRAIIDATPGQKALHTALRKLEHEEDRSLADIHASFLYPEVLSPEQIKGYTLREAVDHCTNRTDPSKLGQYGIVQVVIGSEPIQVCGGIYTRRHVCQVRFATFPRH